MRSRSNAKVASLMGAAVLSSLAGAAQAQVAAAAATPEKLQLAHQVVEAAGGTERMRQVVGVMLGTINAGLEKNMPASQAQLSHALQADMQSELMGLLPAVAALTERAYAQNLTDAELRGLLAWTRSDVGRSINAKLPAITREVAAEEVPLLAQLMPRILQKAVNRACEEAHCTAEQRQVATQAVSQALQRKPS